MLGRLTEGKLVEATPVEGGELDNTTTTVNAPATQLYLLMWIDETAAQVGQVSGTECQQPTGSEHDGEPQQGKTEEQRRSPSSLTQDTIRSNSEAEEPLGNNDHPVGRRGASGPLLAT